MRCDPYTDTWSKHSFGSTSVTGRVWSADFNAVVANCSGWSSTSAKPDEQREEQLVNADFNVTVVNEYDLLTKQRDALVEKVEVNP